MMRRLPDSDAARLISSPGPFLDRIFVRHGPPDILAPYYLAVDAAVRARGLSLEFGDFDELAAVNAKHHASWGRLVTMFDVRVAPIPTDRTYCLVGRDEQGEIATAQAARLYDLTGTTLAVEVTTNKLFYPDSPPPPGERCELTAPFAQQLTGRVAYLGALWIRPDFRGSKLSELISPIGRSYAFATWGCTHAVSFARTELVDKGIVAGYGYNHSEPAFRRYVNEQLDFEGRFVWVTAAETYAVLEQRLARASAGDGARLRHAQGQD